MRLRRLWPVWTAVFTLILSLLSACAPAAQRAQGEPAAPGRIAFVREGRLRLWENGRELQLSGTGSASLPRFSRSGDLIAYMEGGALRVVRRDGSAAWTLAETLPYAGGAVWSPADETLAYATNEGVFTVRFTGEGPGEKRLAARAWTAPAWSPDGRSLAIARTVTGPEPLTGTAEVAVIPSEGGPPRTVLSESFSPQGPRGMIGGAGNPVWSADGRWLAVFRHALGASAAADMNQLAVVPAAGGDPVTLGAGPGSVEAWSVWTPVGAALAFVDGEGRMAWTNKAIRVAVMPPRPPYPSFTPDGYADRDPAWSPDARYLAFTRSRAQAPARMDEPAPEQAIWVADIGAGQARQLPGSEGGMTPVFGRDGSLLFVRPGASTSAREPSRWGSLWLAAAGQPALQVDRIGPGTSYYGQWNWRRYFDWWTGAPLPTQTNRRP